MRDAGLKAGSVRNSGVVMQGSLVISLSGADLAYVGLQVLLTSVGTALCNLKGTPDVPRRVKSH